MQVVFYLFFGYFFLNRLFSTIFAKNLDVLTHRLDGSSLAVIELYKQCAGEGIGVDNGAVTLCGADKPADVRSEGKEIFISVLLVFKATHKSAAATRNFGRVQGKSLLLGHLDGNGLEIIEETRAAEGLTADSDSAEHLGLIADTYLAKLDSRVEGRGEVFNKLAEINASVGGEIEQNLISVE